MSRVVFERCIAPQQAPKPGQSVAAQGQILGQVGHAGNGFLRAARQEPPCRGLAHHCVPCADPQLVYCAHCADIPQNSLASRNPWRA